MTQSSGAKNKVIFFGNGVLADCVLEVLERECQVIFHARTREDLAEAVRLKQAHPEAHGVLASYGVMIKSDVLAAFEPEGIINVHPSDLPRYRGASPIESAILAGDTEFSVSVMKLVRAMDAGPVWWQKSFTGAEIAAQTGVETALPGLPADKKAIYQVLGEAGAEWVSGHLGQLPEGAAQDEAAATFCGKFTKADGAVEPSAVTREDFIRKIVAFSGFPKVKCAVCGVYCTILAAHIPEVGETAVLNLECLDGPLAIDSLQPDGRKAMDAKAFKNGYAK